MDIARINVQDIEGAISGFQGDLSRFQDLEALVGKPLPAAYVEFLMAHDGGEPEYSVFYRQGRTDNLSSFEIGRFYTLSDGIECVFKELNTWKWELGKGMLPIANDGSNNQVYLNLNDEVPSVWYWAHDTYNPDGGDDDGHKPFSLEGAEGDGQGYDKEPVPRFKIANSFEEFIDSLTLPVDFD